VCIEDAKDARIAELEKQCVEWMQACSRNGEEHFLIELRRARAEIEALRKRVGELEDECSRLRQRVGEGFFSLVDPGRDVVDERNRWRARAKQAVAQLARMQEAAKHGES